jgi:hypothetical protein
LTVRGLSENGEVIKTAEVAGMEPDSDKRLEVVFLRL